jgi:hypothetical protein
MKAILALLLFLSNASSFAATVSLSKPAGVVRAASGLTTGAGFVGTFSGAAFNSGFTTQVAGKAVTMPAAMRLASNAASFGVTAIRANPAGLVTSAVAAWLLTYGLQYIDGVWKKAVDTTVPSDALCGMTAEYCVTTGSITYKQYGPYWKSLSGNSCIAGLTQYPNITVSCSKVGTPQPQPAKESDWVAPSAGTLPDAAATDLARNGVALPLQNPVFNPPQVPIAINDPHIDPVTGKLVEDKGIVSPAADGETAEVQTVQQEVNADGTTKKDSTGADVAPQATTKSQCDLFPNSLACLDAGSPENVDLQMNTKNVSISPDSGWGPSSATCPADLTYTMHGGPVIRFSYGPVCTAAGYLRPIIIGLGWLTAVLTFLGISRRVQG